MERICGTFLRSSGLLEPPSKSTEGGVLGPTFQCLIAEQFRRLREGDRFWFENEPKASSYTNNTAFTACQLEEIRKTSLAKVICNNSDHIAAIPKDVLSLVKGFVNCNDLPGVNLEVWKSSFVCTPVTRYLQLYCFPRNLYFRLRGKFLKKLWCCVGGKYNEIIGFYQRTGLIM